MRDLVGYMYDLFGTEHSCMREVQRQSVVFSERIFARGNDIIASYVKNQMFFTFTAAWKMMMEKIIIPLGKYSRITDVLGTVEMFIHNKFLLF